MFLYNVSKLNSTNVRNSFCKVAETVKIISRILPGLRIRLAYDVFLQFTIVNSIATLHCFHGMYSFLNIICVFHWRVAGWCKQESIV